VLSPLSPAEWLSGEAGGLEKGAAADRAARAACGARQIAASVCREAERRDGGGAPYEIQMCSLFAFAGGSRTLRTPSLSVFGFLYLGCF